MVNPYMDNILETILKRDIVASELNRNQNLNQIFQNINCELNVGNPPNASGQMLSIFSLRPGDIVLRIKTFHELTPIYDSMKRDVVTLNNE